MVKKMYMNLKVTFVRNMEDGLIEISVFNLFEMAAHHLVQIYIWICASRLDVCTHVRV